MVFNCSNPDCARPFAHRNGRLFRFHESYTGGAQPRVAHSVRHFWLCELCSSTHTLEYHNGRSMLLEKDSIPSPKALGSLVGLQLTYDNLIHVGRKLQPGALTLTQFDWLMQVITAAQSMDPVASVTDVEELFRRVEELNSLP